MTGHATFDVLGIGNAIVDVLSFSDDTFLQEYHLRKNTMMLIDEPRAELLYSKMGAATECSGGSAANTLAGIASLGGSTAFIGKVRDDQLGSIFTHDLRATGVHFTTPPAANGPATARCLIFVTPDAHRTMNTYIGACAHLSKSDIDEDLIRNAALLYIEGYMWNDPQTKDAIRHAMHLARKHQRKIAFTVSDVFCIETHHAEFLELVKNCDVVFANEAEAMALYRKSTFEEAAAAMRKECPLAVLTRSEKGSVVVSAQGEVTVPAAPVHDVVDTTGAGDLYASGFLYGYLRGWGNERSAELASTCAADIIQHVGARPFRPLNRFVQAA